MAACAPALDWREVRPEGSGAGLLLPCRPSAHERVVQLAGANVTMGLLACRADGVTWALAHADVGDPGRVGGALRELRESAAANVGASAASAPSMALGAVPGATPQPEAGRAAWSGRLPDGTAVQEQVLVAAHGTRVFQLTAIGARIAPEAADTFFGSVRFGAAP